MFQKSICDTPKPTRGKDCCCDEPPFEHLLYHKCYLKKSYPVCTQLYIRSQKYLNGVSFIRIKCVKEGIYASLLLDKHRWGHILLSSVKVWKVRRASNWFLSWLKFRRITTFDLLMEQYGIYFSILLRCHNKISSTLMPFFIQ